MGVFLLLAGAGLITWGIWRGIRWRSYVWGVLGMSLLLFGFGAMLPAPPPTPSAQSSTKPTQPAPKASPPQKVASGTSSAQRSRPPTTFGTNEAGTTLALGAAGSSKSKAPAGAPAPLCRANPLAAVYTPSRLTLVNACETASGVVQWVRHEEDGDFHIRLRPDSPYLPLVNSRDLYGDLVLEIVPADQDKIGIPFVGEHIAVVGAYNLDRDHGWMEIHPVWYLKDLGTGKVAISPPPTDCEIQHPKDAQVCRAASATGSSTSPTPSSGSPSSAVTFVRVASPVDPGSYGDVEVRSAPKAACSIEVDYKSGPSHASGLAPTTADATGRVAWSWKIGTRTTPGTWPIHVTCNASSASSAFTVR